jgi:hypothetical protein
MTMIVDERFEALVRLAGGLSADEIEQHRAALQPLGAGAELAIDDSLVEPPAFRRLALLLTWGGVGIEAALAVVFLAPLSPGLHWLRHGLLLAFCAVTYAVAPVAGFGWLLLAIGASQIDEPRRWWGAAYVTAWLLVLAGSELPWAPWLAAMLGRPGY